MRLVSVRNAADPDEPHTQYVHHNAGLDGEGGSSYIDAVVLRDRDTDANGSLDERRYYVQNWRSDVVALIEPDGDMAEMVRYTPIGINPADFNLDGVLNSSDSTDFLNAYAAWTGGGSYDVRVDWFRFDETKDSSDFLSFNNSYGGSARGRNVLSGLSNRLGYAGYVYDDAIGMYHCRLRVLHPELGRWTRRDPPEFGLNLGQLYDYATSRPLTMTDWMGGPSGFATAQPADGVPGPSLREPTKLRIRCIQIKILGNPIPGSHCWLEQGWGDEKETCSGHNPRTYPGSIRTECGPWDTSSDKGYYDNYVGPFGEGHASTPIKCGSAEDEDAAWSCIQDIIRRIGNCNILYRLPSPNSNTTIWAAASRCLSKHNCRLLSNEPRTVPGAPPVGWDPSNTETQRLIDECLVEQ